MFLPLFSQIQTNSNTQSYLLDIVNSHKNTGNAFLCLDFGKHPHLTSNLCSHATDHCKIMMMHKTLSAINNAWNDEKNKTEKLLLRSNDHSKNVAWDTLIILHRYTKIDTYPKERLKNPSPTQFNHPEMDEDA